MVSNHVGCISTPLPNVMDCQGNHFNSRKHCNIVRCTFTLSLSAGYVKVQKLRGTDITVHKSHLSYAYACAYEEVADNPALVTVYK